MLSLTSATSQRWVEDASNNLELLLLDHAHCEKKAASTGLNMIFRYTNRPELIDVLSPLVREEMEHFELVVDLIRKRGWALRSLPASPYAGRLFKHIRREEPLRLVDTLLACALIEARSCERMKLLSEQLPEAELRAFYKDLLISEARHHHTYVDLAITVRPREEVRARLHELAALEATCLDDPEEELRMHS